MKHYSTDFREKVVQNLLEKNTTPTQLYKIFKTSRNTIYLWLKKYKNTGSLKKIPAVAKSLKLMNLKGSKKLLMRILMLQKNNWDKYMVMQVNLQFAERLKIGYTYKKYILIREK